MIPDAWAAKGHCPVCGGTPLQLRHELAADQLACGRCGAAFEVEDGGPRIRIQRLPARIAASPDDQWRTGPEARAWVQQLAARSVSAVAETVAVPTAPAQASHASANVSTEKPLSELISDPPAIPPAPNFPPPAIPAPPIISASTDLQSPNTNLQLPPEALAKAKELFALRQTIPQIEAILLRSGQWTREQVQAVIAEITKLEMERRAQQRRRLLMAMSGLFTLLLVLGMYALVSLGGGGVQTAPAALSGTPVLGGAVSGPGALATATPSGLLALLPAPLRNLLTAASNGQSGNPAGPGQAPAAGTQYVDPGRLPAPLQTLVPPGVKIIDAPTPAVKQGADSGAPPASSCPRTRDEAARLFGGLPEAWSLDNGTGGWMLISTTQAITLRIPANMVAGYMTFGSDLSINQVNGPAVIENVYMAAVSCE
jgi:hypothetical protein